MPLDLHISVGSPAPIYRQIVEQVCHAVAAGALAPEDQLPSVRELAETLVVNPNTVAKAYGELVREGVAESRAGRGVFIIRRRQVYSRAERLRRLELALDNFVNEAIFLDFNADEIREAVDRRLRAAADRARSNSERVEKDGRRS